ncbi:hypothetical protein F5Y11DRAFT_344738 [Daldinia sp. FL1419]|nr:hypothetical protein F5Y11DRAFT_344738 [Daldinia sp. FL1419]
MFNVKTTLAVILLLATEALAARISYSAKYADNFEVRRFQKLAIIPDEKAGGVIEHMGTWSNSRYTAKASHHDMIIVSNTVPALSKNDATAEVEEMQSIVRQHIKG